MQRISLFRRVVLAAALIGFAAAAQAVTEIQWWHAQTGGNNDRINALAKRFNESQSDYKVTPVYKGSYPEAMAECDRRVPRGQSHRTSCRCSKSAPQR